MLEIINSLKPFFEDNYRRINVREYARLQKISPPTASKLLKNMHGEGLLKKEVDKQYFYYYANKDSDLFSDFSKIFWKIMLKKSGLIEHIKKETLTPLIILFGSLAKAETRAESDIDIAVFTPTKKELTPLKYEKILKRKIQLMFFENREAVKNVMLLNNILSGYILEGSW